MEEEKTPKQKPHTSFNRRLSVAKNLEGNMITAKKIFFKFYFTGGMAKGITVYIFYYNKRLNPKSNLSLQNCLNYIKRDVILQGV